MITAIDSSVLWAVIKQEPGHENWVQALERAAGEGPLLISPVAFSELAYSAAAADQLLADLAILGIAYDPISPAAAHLAGATFRRYRKAGGPREHLVPDFLIAAHALLQADRLAAADRGYLRRWFPSLTLLSPLALG